jgi:hypothetical protein
MTLDKIEVRARYLRDYLAARCSPSARLLNVLILMASKLGGRAHWWVLF